MALLHQSRAPPPLPFLRRHRSRPSQQSNLSQISHIHRRRASLRCSASSSSDPPSPTVDDLVELPLFPLPLVLFPGAVLPLQIFEFWYRILMHTLLHTDLRFGVVFSDSGTGNIADVGCVGEVVKHERLVDDRFFLICKGQERFRVSRVVRTKPYLIAAVARLEDRPPPDPADGDDFDALAVAFDLPLPKTELLIKPMPTPSPVRNFYTEASFSFGSSLLPFVSVSRIAPSDTCRIWKHDANIRDDMTLIGLDRLCIQQSDRTLFFLGSAERKKSKNPTPAAAKEEEIDAAEEESK